MQRKYVLSTLVLFMMSLLAASGIAGGTQSALAQTTGPLLPSKLAIYYGFPSAVNGANGDISVAVATFRAYDVVVFGDTLQLPQYDPTDPNRNNPYYDGACTQNSHLDHDNTVAIIQALTAAGTDVYGYISIGGENTARVCPSPAPQPTPLTQAEIENFVDLWKAMGVTGVFFDEAGYDFGTDRARQNAAIDYAHSQGLRVFINAFLQEEIFEPMVVGTITYGAGNLTGQTSSVAMNPTGAPTSLGPNDISLLESYQIIQGNYQDPEFWQDRADKALHYKRRFGTQIATVTTASDSAPDCGFNQAQLDYAWWSTLLYGFDYMGWGEGFNFSAAGACNGSLPMRTRPTPVVGDKFTSPSVVHDLTMHRRPTDLGVIEVDSSLYTGEFTMGFPAVPTPGLPTAAPADRIAWWPGDGSAQDIAGFNHGQLNTAKSWFAPGKVSLAFSFDGLNDSIVFGTGPAVIGTGDFSIETWIKTTDSQGVILQQRDASAAGFDGQYILSVGGLFVSSPGHVCWTTFGDGVFGFDLCSTAPVNDGAWHHIAAVRESDGTGRIYIDGSTVDSQLLNPPRDLKSLNVYAGADRRNGDSYYSGLIDEITIVNRALSATEVSTIYAAGSAGKLKPDAHAVWVFSDEVSVQAARDDLVNRSVASGVNALYLSVYQPVVSSNNRLMYADADIADLIGQAHTAGIQVWAAYGAPDWPSLGCDPAGFPLQRMQEVIDYNTANPNAPFDGVILDVEPPEPQSAQDYQDLLALYDCTLDMLKPAGLGLQTAIRFFWENLVEYPSNTNISQMVYEHVVDMDMHKVVVMGYRDFAGDACLDNGIICLDEDEVTHAGSQQKAGLILAGAETGDCATGCGPEFVTFFEEGQTVLNREAGCVADHFAGNPGFGGFAIHRYNGAYLSGLPAWPTSNAQFPGVCAQNHPPGVDVGGPYRGDEGSAILLSGAIASDLDGDPLTMSWSVDSSLCAFDDATILNPNLTCGDNGNFTVTLEVSDGANDPVSSSSTVGVANVAPSIDNIDAPVDPMNINNQSVSVAVTFSDPGTADTHNVIWDWGDGNLDTQTGVTSPTAQGHTYTTPGVYKVQVMVTDDDGDSDSQSYEFIVIYDPEGGFVTGGGWINSPAGAYVSDPSLTGKANFGFVSKYQKGATVPTGQTEFQFKVANLNFHSSSYEWLVVAGAKAQYKGTGTINGAGNYGFMLTAIDEALTPSTDVDLFRIKIWDKNNSDAIVYDNQMGLGDDANPTTAIAGGSIVVHKGDKSVSSASIGEATPDESSPRLLLPLMNR